MSNGHLSECYCVEDCDCEKWIAEYISDRALSDAREPNDIHLDALAEGYDRDWRSALAAHDWFCNQCTESDQFGERCKKRRGHGTKHDASLNGAMQFLYSDEAVARLAYGHSPFLSMVPR